jgi:hypothetical protein
MTACRVCGGEAVPAFEALVLRRHRVGYHHCAACGFLQTDLPRWLEEAYADSITLQDTGLVARNQELAEVVAPLLYFLFDRGARFVDYAGGYGLFTRLMRDVGFDFRSYDPHSPNLLSRGFEASSDERGVELVTSFESFEHFAEPMVEIPKLLAMSRNVLFTTETLPAPVPAPGQWWYYGPEHGQHVAFYERRTLEHIAARFGLRLHRVGRSLFLMTDRVLSPRKLWMLRKLRGPALARWVRRRMRSRTQEDSALLGRPEGAPSAPARAVPPRSR